MARRTKGTPAPDPALRADMAQQQEKELPAPDIARLKSDYQRVVRERATRYWTRQRANVEARYALWPHQSYDGRKWKSNHNKTPFPWLGATDSRVLLIDQVINEDVAAEIEALRRMHVQVRPSRLGFHSSMGRNLTVLLNWLKDSTMDEFYQEFEILRNMVHERGAAAMGVFWWREEVRRRQTVTMDDVANYPADLLSVVQQRAPAAGSPRLGDLIADPLMEEAAAAVIVGALDEMSAEEHGWESAMSKARVLKIVRDLRETGEADFPITVIQNDRPTIVAMTLNEDLFLPAEQTDARWRRFAFRRELCTEAQLKERCNTMDWNPNWVDWVIETARGVTTYPNGKWTYDPLRIDGEEWVDTRDLFEVATSWRREYDEDGIPRINQVVFSPYGSPKYGGGPEYAASEPLDYDHGDFPFVVFQRERRTRRPDDSRGLGETIGSWQQIIKRHYDAECDRSDIATLSPMFHPPDEEPDAWGPGVKVPTRQPGSFGYIQPPRADGGGPEVIAMAREHANEYAGRLNQTGSNRVEAAALLQKRVNTFLEGAAKVIKMMLQLWQQYGSEETYIAVTGGQQPEPLHLKRSEIEGEFMVQCTFNTALLDPELMQELLALVQQILQLDTTGRVDRDAIMELVLEMVSPGLSAKVLRPGEQASMQEADDEQSVIAKIATGIGVDIKPGQAYGLRLQTLQKTIMSSPRLQRIIQEDPQVAKMIETRIKQLQFGVEQHQQNPMIGRLYGTQPQGVTSGAGAPTGPQPGRRQGARRAMPRAMPQLQPNPTQETIS